MRKHILYPIVNNSVLPAFGNDIIHMHFASFLSQAVGNIIMISIKCPIILLHFALAGNRFAFNFELTNLFHGFQSRNTENQEIHLP